MSEEPVEKLEQRALEERDRLHETASELKEKMVATRENLSISHQAQRHFLGASLVVAAVGFLVGYQLGGPFNDH